ncbi:MAG: methyltransferase domain-containing protein, partial [Thermomicrobiales bacterium]
RLAGGRIVISPWLISVLRCPVCVQESPGSSGLMPLDSALVCAACGTRYPLHRDYVDMRPPTGLSGKETVYNDAAADLDDPEIRPPVLSAGVRQRVLCLLLRPRADDALLEIGCGNGKFAVWNRDAVAHLVGLDPAARFADMARATVDLVQGDARALPFAPGVFTGAYSVDVFEHLDLPGVRAHLAEVRRVSCGDGRYFCFSNTRERSWLNRLIDPGRRLAEALHRAGVVDRTRDHLRKGDHVKAVETTDALQDELYRAGLGVERLWYLNPLVATYVETIGFAVVERLLNRRAGVDGHTGSSISAESTPSVRAAAAQRPAVQAALRVATALLMADVIFFRRIRTGPFFLLARPDRRR